MVWTRLIEGLTEALRAEGLDTPENRARIELALPRERAHGDWTTNLALQVARAAKRPPRQLAEALVAAFPRDPQTFGAVEVAGPGFINFRYADGFLAALPSRITGAGEGFGHHPHAAGTPVLVEYVSANPTGPLNVVNARAAAVGAALVRLLAATGHRAAGEFYVNDAGHQVELLGASLAARFAERVAVPLEMPANGYMGDYLRDLAGELDPVAARAALDAGDAAWFRDQALERVLAWQRRDLDAYGAEFARWFRESALHADGSVAATRDALEARGVTYHARHPESGYEREEDAPSAGADAGEATWLRSSGFGDSQDRVLVRSNGAPTYLLPDTAYHRDKRARGFRHAIDLWGPDHHAYVRTLRASLLALGLEPDFLEVLIVQQVNLIRDGAVLDMSKRKGQLITLRELMDDVGADCAKFFFLMRTTNAHLDFDLDLARSQSDENPAYYVQYAHARIASIQRRAAARGIAPAEGPVRLEHPAEVALVRRLAEFPEVVRGAAFAREPHRLPAYLVETAAELHRFYHHCRVLGDDAARSAERLRVVEAARVVLRNGLALMGVSAPERLERAESEPEEEAAS